MADGKERVLAEDNEKEREGKVVYRSMAEEEEIEAWLSPRAQVIATVKSRKGEREEKCA